jgi:uncharacterized protein YjdB
MSNKKRKLKYTKNKEYFIKRGKIAIIERFTFFFALLFLFAASTAMAQQKHKVNVPEGWIATPEEAAPGETVIIRYVGTKKVSELEIIKIVSVNKATTTIGLGDTEQLTATTNPANKTVTWTSSDQSIAMVDATTGVVTGVALGTATITATSEDGAGSCEVTVSSADYVDLGIVVVDGKHVYFAKTNKYDEKLWYDLTDDELETLPIKDEWGALINSCYWEWDDTEGHKGYYVYKAKADADKGVVKNKLNTNPTLSASYTHTGENPDICIFLPLTGGDRYGNYWSSTLRTTDWNYTLCFSQTNDALGNTCDAKITTTNDLSVRMVWRSLPIVSINKTTTTIGIDGTEQLTATTIPANKPVTWTSSAPSVAMVDANGVVTGVAAGTATITATTSEGYKVSCVVTVKPPFTVSAEGKKVIFSSGNLQYHCKNRTWRFAENQYDYVGDANKNIAENYDGWIDLFGWGTWLEDGNPLNTSTSNSIYTWDDTKSSAIGIEWTTLSKDEWDYLLTNISRATTRYVKAKIKNAANNDVEGLIIFPDNYSNASISTANDLGSDYQDLSAYWSDFESAGAVFLPSAGFRMKTSVYYISILYWTATADTEEGAFALSFDSGVGSAGGRACGAPVRLVRAL